MPKKTRPGCQNPFGQEGHKGVGDHSLSSDLIEECKKYNVELQCEVNERVCIRCYGKVKDEIKAALKRATIQKAAYRQSKRKLEADTEEGQEEVAGPSNYREPALQDTKSPRIENAPLREFAITTSSCSTENAEQSSQASCSQQSHSLALEEVNSTLQNLGVPVVRSKEIRKTKMMAQRFLQTHQVLADKFGALTKKPLTLPPDCRHCEKLITDLVARYPSAKTTREKLQMLTSVPKYVSYRSVKEKFGCSRYIALQAAELRTSQGAFSAPDFVQPKRVLESDVKEAVKLFYVNDENSRVFPGVRNTVKAIDVDGVKRRVSKRHLLLNLEELHEEFKTQHESMKIGLTAFSQLKPSFCIWPGPRGHHITCTCIIHENFKALMMAAGLMNKTEVFLLKYLCADAGPDCSLGLCSNCPKYVDLEKDLSRNLDEEVVFNLWQSTDRMTLVQVRENSQDFISRLREQVPKVASHHFIFKQQSTYIQELKAKLEADETCLVCTVDFGMNYSFIGQNEPQSAHFNRRQCTIHPFVFDGFLNGQKFQKSYIVISDDLNHNSNSFHAFRDTVLGIVKVDYPHCKKVYYVSDGSAAQYKNFKNLANLVYHEEDFGIRAEWHFSATAHGKSTCDALTAVIKREARLESLKAGGMIIQDVHQLNIFSLKQWKDTPTMKIVLVEKAFVEDWNARLEERYQRASKLKGIQQCHSFVPIEGSEKVEVRRYSASSSFKTFHVFLDSSTEETTAFVVGTLVAVKALTTFHIGKIIRISDDESELIVSFMKRIGRKNLFMWPDTPKDQEVYPGDVLSAVRSLEAGSDFKFSISPAELKKLNTLKNAAN